MSSATVERDSMSQKPIDTWKISAKSHSDAVPPSKGRHQAAAPRQNLISSLVASLPVGGSTVFTPGTVPNPFGVVGGYFRGRLAPSTARAVVAFMTSQMFEGAALRCARHCPRVVIIASSQ